MFTTPAKAWGICSDVARRTEIVRVVPVAALDRIELDNFDVIIIPKPAFDLELLIADPRVAQYLHSLVR